MSFKPLLASEAEDLDKLRYPVYISPKLDGIRVVIRDGIPMTRSLKPIRNRHITSLLNNPVFNFLDGEIIVGDPVAPDVFQKTQSGVMSFEGTPTFLLHCFDYTKYPEDNFILRLQAAESICKDHPDYLISVPHGLVENRDQLEKYENMLVQKGFEGAMLRDPAGHYKMGRSTFREGILLKLKRFLDDEAEIIGFEEMLSNQNELETNELGYAKRSSKKEGMVPMDTLGKLRVQSPKFPASFGVGSGFTSAMRKEIWDNKEKYLGKTITYKYQPVGIKELPRMPIFKGFREQE